MFRSHANEEKSLRSLIDPRRLPKHIAVIMDGNGRWAKSHKLQRMMGHRRGMSTVREVVRGSSEIGVQVLSLYAFSEENWNRPQEEVRSLMSLLKQYVIKERKELNEKNIRLRTTGNISKLPKEVRGELEKTIGITAKNSGMILNLALSYSGRDDIIRAINKYVKNAVSAGQKHAPITQEIFTKYLDTNDLPDPDLLIRTSGEQRISNFMLWQLAYTEIYVTDVLWPEFKKADLYKAIIEFQKRERRFGLVSEQLTKRDAVIATY